MGPPPPHPTTDLVSGLVPLINHYILITENGYYFPPQEDCPITFNAHTHLCRANWKPVASDIKSFLKLIMKYRSEITEMESVDGAIKAIKHMLQTGIQGYISHQNHRHIHAVIEAVREFPLRHNFARMCTDNPSSPENIREKALESIQETVDLLIEFPDIGILYGPMGLVDCSLDMFEAYSSKVSNNLLMGLQTHVAEEYEGTTKIKKKYGKSEIELLFEAGCLSENTFLVHCTYISEKDIEIIFHTKSKVVICPRSSFNPKTFLLLIKKNVPIFIGTDAYGFYIESLTEEWKVIKNNAKIS